MADETYWKCPHDDYEAMDEEDKKKHLEEVHGKEETKEEEEE